MVRGNVYYVADGSYGSYIFDDATNGSQYIELGKPQRVTMARILDGLLNIEMGLRIGESYLFKLHTIDSMALIAMVVMQKSMGSSKTLQTSFLPLIPLILMVLT